MGQKRLHIKLCDTIGTNTFIGGIICYGQFDFLYYKYGYYGWHRMKFEILTSDSDSPQKMSPENVSKCLCETVWSQLNFRVEMLKQL